MKHLLILVALLLVVPFNVVAEEAVQMLELEAHALKIKLSKDGTGIIRITDKGECYKHCEDIKLIKITKQTKAYANGVGVNILAARSRAGKTAGVVFNGKTREAVDISWSHK